MYLTIDICLYSYNLMIQEERKIVLNILGELKFGSVPQKYLSELMMAVDCKNNILFSQDLFIDRIIYIYHINKSEYEKHLSKDHLARISKNNRILLMTIFKKYHQHHIKKKQKQRITEETKSMLNHLQLPNTQNIQQIISFQKQMYRLFKNVMPKASSSISENTHYSHFHRPYASSNMSYPFASYSNTINYGKQTYPMKGFSLTETIKDPEEKQRGRNGSGFKKINVQSNQMPKKRIKLDVGDYQKRCEDKGRSQLQQDNNQISKSALKHWQRAETQKVNNFQSFINKEQPLQSQKGHNNSMPS